MYKAFFCICIVILSFESALAGTYSGGDGSSGNPYQLASVADLIELSKTMYDWSSHFIQTADIVFNENEQLVDWDGDGTATWDAEDQPGFSPIGSQIRSFSGIYNGQNHSISNLFINRSGTDRIGFFGHLTASTIQSINILNANVTGKMFVAGLAGVNEIYSSINNCYANGSVTGTDCVGGLVGGMYYLSSISYCFTDGSVTGNFLVGGLIGYYSESSISYCHSNCLVSGPSCVGGLAGRNYSGSINNCYATGTVSGDGHAGGLVGDNYNTGSINNCYATGAVSGGSIVGGIVGYNSSASISNCYATGSVSGTTDVTGFVGLGVSGTYTNNFFDTQTSGKATGTGATGKTSAQMKDIATFTDYTDGSNGLNNPVWDFENNPNDDAANNNTWVLNGAVNNGYPTFEWCAAPTVQASNIRFSNITRTSMTVSWSRGNKEGSVLLGSQQYRIPSAPLSDRAEYSFITNSNYSLAPITQGARVLYYGNDANPSVNVTNLTRYKLVYFKVCEFNTIASPVYLQDDAYNNPRSRWTLRRDGLAEEDLTIDTEYPYPNPVSNSISITLDLFEDGIVNAQLIDNSGRQVAVLYNQSHNFGTYDLIFDLSCISSGAYQLVITKGYEAVAYPISVVR